MVAEPVSRGKRSTIRHTGATRSALWAPTAGNEKTVTEINLPPPEEIPVATLPSSVLQIATEPGQPGFEGVDLGERRNCAADARVQIGMRPPPDRKSTRLNSSHDQISYAVFCLKKKNKAAIPITTSYTDL